MKKSLGAKTMIYPTPVLIVGTYDAEDKPNVMAVAWGGICCSSPPCVAIALRKATYTYGNIMQQGGFTISIPSEKHARYADYFGMVSGKSVDKFAATGLTPVRSALVNAPYIDEFPFVLECRLLQHIEIGLHTQFIGEIVDVKAEEVIFDENGRLDIEKLKPFSYAPEANAYYGMDKFLGEAYSIGQDIQKKLK
ncbi:MAG: flavin reductase family protein [Deltaproteobacteria bacterium]|nr:flavin reductase family protein [Deltaproteobacteria bacterium]MBN2845716.1 flavin reductase family protein [Deltaproteobacteria bacterium]